MEHCFKEITNKAERFFDILPADWQEGIAPYWSAYEHNARIFVLESAMEVVGGGIVFTTVSPDCQPAYKEEAQSWFDKGFHYIGFLWISEAHRDKQLGSKWLQHLFSHMPEQSFWLSIEDLRLSSFYNRNGFQLITKVELDYYPEWVMTKDYRETTVLVQSLMEQRSRPAMLEHA